VGGFIGLVVVVSAMWMYFESRSFEYDKGDVTGLAAMRPVGWFFTGLLLWLVAFPLYLASRAKLRAAGEARLAKLKTDDRYAPKPQSKVGPVLVSLASFLLLVGFLASKEPTANAGAGVQTTAQNEPAAQAVQQVLPKRDPNVGACQRV